MTVILAVVTDTAAIKAVEQRQLDAATARGYQVVTVSQTAVTDTLVTTYSSGTWLLYGIATATAVAAAPILSNKASTVPLLAGSAGAGIVTGVSTIANASTANRDTIQIRTQGAAFFSGGYAVNATPPYFSSVLQLGYLTGTLAANALRLTGPTSFSSNNSHVLLDAGQASAQTTVTGARRGWYFYVRNDADVTSLLPIGDSLMTDMLVWTFGEPETPATTATVRVARVGVIGTAATTPTTTGTGSGTTDTPTATGSAATGVTGTGATTTSPTAASGTATAAATGSGTTGTGTTTAAGTATAAATGTGTTSTVPTTSDAAATTSSTGSGIAQAEPAVAIGSGTTTSSGTGTATTEPSTGDGADIPARPLVDITATTTGLHIGRLRSTGPQVAAMTSPGSRIAALTSEGPRL